MKITLTNEKCRLNTVSRITKEKERERKTWLNVYVSRRILHRIYLCITKKAVNKIREKTASSYYICDWPPKTNSNRCCCCSWIISSFDSSNGGNGFILPPISCSIIENEQLFLLYRNVLCLFVNVQCMEKHCVILDVRWHCFSFGLSSFRFSSVQFGSRFIRHDRLGSEKVATYSNLLVGIENAFGKWLNEVLDDTNDSL